MPRSTSLNVHSVSVEALLNRRPLEIDGSAISESLRGEVVLVTGAAGSIGSELCRHIGRFAPSLIVGLEVAETPLFELERQMHQLLPDVPFQPEIGSIQNRCRVLELMHRCRPAAVFHAAAYKHVPMMESHVIEAIENNVLGTENVARAAADCEVSSFVLISSDKAVKPASIMGATKRAAERVVNSLSSSSPAFVSVRFGNVLGSNGSVVTVFREQIAAGGPVTITHPDMRRYCMTADEAVRLVLQAFVLGQGGEIFTLDMGEPLSIVDLAMSLISLSGLRPHEDIAIEFTGVRPGEKLDEDLAESQPTAHGGIRRVPDTPLADAEIRRTLAAMRQSCFARDSHTLIEQLRSLVPEYSPVIARE